MNKAFKVFILVLIITLTLFRGTIYSKTKISLKILSLAPVPDTENEYFLVLYSPDSSLNLEGVKVDVSYDLSNFKKGQVYNPLKDTWAGYNTHWSNTPSLNFKDSLPLILKIKLLDVPEDSSYFYVRLRYKKSLDSSSVKTYSFTETPFSINTGEFATLDTSDSTPSSSTSEPQNSLSDNSSSPDTLSDNSSPTLLSADSSTEDTYEEPNKPLDSNIKKNILITEFMPNPDNQNEWVEIYNNNDTKVELNNWFIDDILNGGGSPFSFSLSLNAKEYAVVEINKTLFNNSGDTVYLLDENKNPLYAVSYKKTVKGASIQKLSNNKWYITLKNTKGKSNLSFEEVVLQNDFKATQEDSLDEEALVKEEEDYKEEEESKSSTNNTKTEKSEEANLDKGEVLGASSQKDTVNIPPMTFNTPKIQPKEPIFITTQQNLKNNKLTVLKEKQVPKPYKLFKKIFLDIL